MAHPVNPSMPQATPQSGTVFLMYHELELPGRGLCLPGAGYSRYVVSEAGFHQHMQFLRQNGWQGLSVTQALLYSPAKNVAITFDDGSETDLLCAAPILKELGFGARSEERRVGKECA